MLAGKRILLIVAGGIAAYKTLELVRRIRDAGGSVRCADSCASTASLSSSASARVLDAHATASRRMEAASRSASRRMRSARRRASASTTSGL